MMGPEKSNSCTKFVAISWTPHPLWRRADRLKVDLRNGTGKPSVVDPVSQNFGHVDARRHLNSLPAKFVRPTSRNIEILILCNRCRIERLAEVAVTLKAKPIELNAAWNALHCAQRLLHVIYITRALLAGHQSEGRAAWGERWEHTECKVCCVPETDRMELHVESSHLKKYTILTVYSARAQDSLSTARQMLYSMFVKVMSAAP
jgi:hypothetical protein